MNNLNIRYEYFEVRDYLITLNDKEVRQSIIELTSLLNQEKGDSINIPKKLIEIREFAKFNDIFLPSSYSIDQLKEIIENSSSIDQYPQELVDMAQTNYDNFLSKYNEFKNTTHLPNSTQQDIDNTKIKKIEAINTYIDNQFKWRVEYLKKQLKKIKLLGNTEYIKYLKKIRDALFSYEMFKSIDQDLNIPLPITGFHLFFNPYNGLDDNNIVAFTENLYPNVDYVIQNAQLINPIKNRGKNS